uniref:Sugar phosphate isomerase/epimerase n=1 Tax=Desulfomonile tiedjei TaxID=2358 RepID=A0A7C4EV33_9BACT
MFKIGTTSYIYPADILTNVKKLAGKVHDIELVLFEFEQESNIPNSAVMKELIAASRRSGTSYTVHLPLDLALAGARPDIDKATRVIDLTRSLHPAGYVVHLDGADELDMSKRLANSLASLKALAHAELDPTLLCVENLENEPPAFIDHILNAMPVSTCVDIGHLWKRGADPIPILERRLERTRIVHLHGMQERDHQSLSVVAPHALDRVAEFLVHRYDGIVTIEIFSEADLRDSLDALRASVARVSETGPLASRLHF